MAVNTTVLTVIPSTPTDKDWGVHIEMFDGNDKLFFELTQVFKSKKDAVLFLNQFMNARHNVEIVL